MQATQPLFRTDNNLAFPGITPAQWDQLFHDMCSKYGVSQAQMCEAISYSMAMVIRVALGLSAEDAIISAFITDSFAGTATLATIRHLVTAGTEAHVFILNSDDTASPPLKAQLFPLEKMGVQIKTISQASEVEGCKEQLSESHAALTGIYHSEEAELIDSLTNLLNDKEVPVHCLICPPGVDPETGERSKNPLFASSTLSTGAPLSGLYKGGEYAGRLYVADISCPSDLYSKFGSNLCSIFAEQPVVQIFPVTEEEQKTASPD